MKPAILTAAEAPSVYLASRFYAALGFSVLPCTGKKPALDTWKHLQTRPALPATIDAWHQVDLLENVGIICGRVSGNLVVIDLDGDKATWAYFEAFPDLLNTYTVRSGSGHGMHFYYYVRDVPPTTRVTGLEAGNIELRSDGTYVIAPPSIHPVTGNRYAVADAVDIQHVDTLRPVVEWIKSLIADKHGGHMPPPANAGPVKNPTAYGRAALMGECDKIRRASVGGRNNVLYEAALRMGSLINDGKIDRVTVERALVSAAGALSDDDGEGATWRTITSGIQTGMESSRERNTNRA